MSQTAVTRVARIIPGRLVDHTSCYHELRHVERERDELRAEVAKLRAERARLERAELLSLEESW